VLRAWISLTVTTVRKLPYLDNFKKHLDFNLFRDSLVQHDNYDVTIAILPAQPKLVLVYRPRKDERLSLPRQQQQSAQDCCAVHIVALLFAVPTVMPHWASGCMQLAHGCCPERRN